MREALVDVFINDVGLIKRQVSFNENRHLTVRIHRIDFGRFVVEIDILDFKVTALFIENETASVREGAGRAGKKNHHR